MIPIRGAIAAFLMLITLAPLTALADNGNPRATILCYHVVHSPSDTPYALHRAQFREQMEYLKDAGYTVISLDELYDYVTGARESIPDNSVVITVDDGWLCTYTEIFPVMKEMGFPFTIFVYPKFVIGGDYALTWDMIREMAASGVDVESHTMSHHFLARRRHRSLGSVAYGQWLRTELAESRKTIARETGQEVRFLAYPYGSFDQAVEQATERAGYEAALSTKYGPVSRDTNPYALNRVSIDGSTTMRQFREFLGTHPLAIADATPRPGVEMDPQTPVVSARILDPQKVDPASVQMGILGEGEIPWFYDPENGTVSLVLREPLPGGRHDVVVWGRERETGRRVESMWMFRAATSTAATRTVAVQTAEETTASVSMKRAIPISGEKR